ncbi:MAG: DUF1003 domain-containing protein [Raineya sp.]|jgi:uncharacterized membrane protein|nr:DUF1003 domain-containing protein [Raineya sp.]
MNDFISDISGKEFPKSEKIKGSSIRKVLFEFIQKTYPQFSQNSNIALSELNHFRTKFISECLVNEIGELGDLEKTVLSSLQERTLITEQIDDDKNTKLTFGQKMADGVATFGGSWRFIISFGIFLVVWIIANAFLLANKGFDPYPFILLNLILSCLAAIQAPIIMMSQNRQEEKDRERAKKDYMINLKSELEIRMLHEKIDHLIMHQQQELLEIQRVQIDMMNDILKQVEKK